jgi:cell division protein FtsI (penicillin-binding protein 3)
VLIATDLKTKSLFVNSALIKNPADIAQGLAHIFPDLSYNEITKKIAAGRRQKDWILLRRNLSPKQVEAVINLHIAGLIFQDDRARVYLQKSVTSPIVG